MHVQYKWSTTHVHSFPIYLISVSVEVDVVAVPSLSLLLDCCACCCAVSVVAVMMALRCSRRFIRSTLCSYSCTGSIFPWRKLRITCRIVLYTESISHEKVARLPVNVSPSLVRGISTDPQVANHEYYGCTVAMDNTLDLIS